MRRTGTPPARAPVSAPPRPRTPPGSPRPTARTRPRSPAAPRGPAPPARAAKQARALGSRPPRSRTPCESHFARRADLLRPACPIPCAAMVVRELELDLDAFEGPFDLLLTLVLREELDLAEIDVATIVVAFIEHLAEREQLDLEACGEFLVLVASLLELKARALFPDEEAELADLGPEEAAEELARRLAEYRRMKEAAAWLAERLAGERDRFFRIGPAPLAPKPGRRLAQQDPEQLAATL